MSLKSFKHRAWKKQWVLVEKSSKNDSFLESKRLPNRRERLTISILGLVLVIWGLTLVIWDLIFVILDLFLVILALWSFLDSIWYLFGNYPLVWFFLCCFVCVVCFSLFVVCSLFFVLCSSLFVLCCSLCVVCFSLFIVCCLLFLVSCLLNVVRCLLSVVCYSIALCFPLGQYTNNGPQLSKLTNHCSLRSTAHSYGFPRDLVPPVLFLFHWTQESNQPFEIPQSILVVKQTTPQQNKITK